MRRCKLPIVLLAAIAAVFIASAAYCSTIKVGYFPYDGYHMTDANGTRSGYGYEYLQKLRIYTGWHYQYIGGPEHPWHTMLPMLEDGSIDILTSVSKTADRLKKYEFSALPIGVKTTIITVKSGNLKYSERDYTNWDGIRVGLLQSNSRNNRFENFAAKQGFKYVPVIFNSSEELQYALQIGQVDAIVSSSLRKVENEWILARFDPVPYYVCVKKGRRDLMSKIDLALDQLQSDEPGLARTLYDKYYSPASMSDIYYSHEERHFIEKCKKEGKVFTALANPDRSPYTFRENGKLSGSNAEIVNLIMSRTGLSYKYADVKDREEYIKAMREKKYDLVVDMPFDYNVADNCCYILTNPYYKASISQVRLNKPIDSAPQKAAVLPFFGLMSSVVRHSVIQEKEILNCESNSECVNSVLEGRASSAYLLTNSAQEAAALDPKNRLVTSKVPYVTIPFAIGVRDGANGILPRIIQKAAASVTEEEAMPLTYKYLDRSKEAKGFIAYIYDNPALFAAFAVSVILLAAALAILLIIYKARIKERKLNAALEDTLCKLKKADLSLIHI